MTLPSLQTHQGARPDAVFLLVQEGKIRLDDKITRLVSGLPPTWSQINVLDCLSHTSGLPDIPDLYEVFDAPVTSTVKGCPGGRSTGAMKPDYDPMDKDDGKIGRDGVTVDPPPTVQFNLSRRGTLNIFKMLAN